MQVKQREDIISGVTVKVKLTCGNLYITINSDKEGKLFEVFMQMGKAGGCACSQLEATARLVSLCLRCSIDVREVIDQLKGIRCPNVSYYNGKEFYSCADAIAKVLEENGANNR